MKVLWIMLVVASGWGSLLAWVIVFNGLPWNQRIARSLGFGAFLAVLLTAILVWLTNGTILHA